MKQLKQRRTRMRARGWARPAVTALSVACGAAPEVARDRAMGAPNAAQVLPTNEPQRDAAHDVSGVAAELPYATVVIRNVRVFDGERVLDRATVVVRDGVISEVTGADAAPRLDAGTRGGSVIDGAGSTLLPGLMDSHAHVYDARALEQSAAFGVTTVLDMMSNPQIGSDLKRRASEKTSGLADLRVAGNAVTVPGGHGTEYGVRVPTVTSVNDMPGFVQSRVAEGSDFIKVIYDSGRAWGISWPTLSKPMLAAAIESAHTSQKLAVVHIGTQHEAREAIAYGADGLAHLFMDRFPESDFASFVSSRRAFVVPTLSVLNSIAQGPVPTAWVNEERVSSYLSNEAATALKQRFPASKAASLNYDAADQTVRELRAANVDILAGTDAPNAGTTYGASLHGELALLVRAGLSPHEALAAATSKPADRFGFRDRGRIAPSKRADMFLVHGDPTTDIHATRAIAAVWKNGIRIDRDAYRARLDAEKLVAKRPPACAAVDGLSHGLIADFEERTFATSFGYGFTATTDSVIGGQSTGGFTAVANGAHRSRGSLLVTGIVRGIVRQGEQAGWAGVLFSPGEKPFSCANLSTKKGFSFAAKGDGHAYRVLVYAASRGPLFAQQVFTAKSEWKTHSFSFADFDGLDGGDITAIAFVGGPKPGPIRFQIDDLALY